MKLNNDGYNLICEFEGLRLQPYLCSAKVPTIGYGNTFYQNGKKVTLNDKSISQFEAFEMFKTVADDFAKKVDFRLKNILNQNQFNALVSFAYNVGIKAFTDSTLLKKVNKLPNDAKIVLEFQKWNKAGGKIIQGLVNRRQKEIDLYFKL